MASIAIKKSFCILKLIYHISVPKCDGDLQISKWGPNEDLIFSEMGAYLGHISGIYIPDICHFYYTHTFSGLKILHSKARKFATKLPRDKTA